MKGCESEIDIIWFVILSIGFVLPPPPPNFHVTESFVYTFRSSSSDLIKLQEKTKVVDWLGGAV